jgi:hypothetical protein
MSSKNFRREVGFSVSLFSGMLVFSVGISLLVMALTIGLRREQGGYLPPGAADALLWGGLVVVLVGSVVRLFRSRTDRPETTRRVSTGIVVVGAVGALVGLARETTVSAPFVASPVEKAVLFVASFVALTVGWLLIRAAARLVGW